MAQENLMEILLAVLPYWHCAIDKPLKQSLKDKMSLESYYCLQTLRREGPMTMSQLAQRLKITKQQATKTVERLCAVEFIERLYDEQDRRVIRIRPTARALHYIEQDFYQNSQFLEALGQRLGPEGQADFQHALQILLAVLPKLE